MVRAGQADGTCGFHAVEYSTTCNTNRDALQKAIRNSPQAWIVYDNHGAATCSLAKECRSKLACYHEIGSDNLRAFHAIESPPPPGFGFNFFVLGLVEAALTDVVILDERVAEAFYDERRGFRGDKLVEARCYPLFSVRVNNSQVYVSDLIKDRVKGRVENSCDDAKIIKNKEGLYIDNGQSKIKILYSSKPIELQKCDFVIIHQGVIDRLHDLGKWRQNYIQFLYNLTPSVVVTSGRGKTLRHVPSTMPFIEFSTISESTYGGGGLSKYHLVRALMSTRGGGRS